MAAVFENEARDIRDFLAAIGDQTRQGERTLAERAGMLLDAYEARLKGQGVPDPAITPARLALAVQIDQAVRSEKRVRISAWVAAAHTHLFGRRDITIDDLRRFQSTAAVQGAEYAPLAAFLTNSLERLEGRRRNRDAVSKRPALYLFLGVLALLLALAGYALFLDYRYHADLMATYETEAAVLSAGDPLVRLDRLADLSAQVGRAAALAPMAQIARVPQWDSARRTRAHYAGQVAEELPRLLRDALEEALATEGEDIAQYDSLRAWSVLSGASEWQPSFLTGWLAAREATLGTGGLARHAAALTEPSRDLAPPDAELLEQSRAFAAAAPEEARAYLELTRMEDLAALPPWTPDAIPGLEEVVFRRSGRPLSEGVPAIHTAASWNYANERGVGLAVQKARSEALSLFLVQPPVRNDAPDRLLGLLQDETLQGWKTWLKDLRVRPFDDQTSAIRISGALAQRNSPLEALIRAVWHEVGGLDRSRPHALQLKVATAFGPRYNTSTRDAWSR